METTEIKKDIMNYIENKEYVANTYVIKSFSITMLVYLVMFLLNCLNIFIIDKDIMKAGFIPSMIVYGIMLCIKKFIPLTDRRFKYIKIA